MSRPTPEPVLLGHGPGALPPAAWAGAAWPAGTHGWLDATATVTLQAEPGAAFADAAAVEAWARRVWLDLAGGADAGTAASLPAVAWRAGAGRQATVGATCLVIESDSALQPLQSLAPLWAGVLAHATKVLHPTGGWRLVVAEGRALTVLDIGPRGLQRLDCRALEGDDAAALASACVDAPAGGVWVAGHLLPGVLPEGLRPVPGLGLPGQATPALLAALQDVQQAEPAFRRPSALSPRLAVALVATASAVLAVAAWSGFEAREALGAAQARAEARQRLASAPVPRALADADDERRLRQPWAQRFAAAEAALPAGGGWLRFEQRRDQPRLLLAGEAASPAEALAVARTLAAHPAVAEAAVLRSESQSARGGLSVARFEIGVRLAAPGG